MAKALVFSDLHIHSHKDRVDRLLHCLEVLYWVFRLAAEHRVDYIFFLGDLFHERSKIDVLTYLRTFEAFMKYMIADAPDRDVYLLVGNHDMYHKERWDVNSVKPLTAIPRVHLVDRPQRLEIGGRRVDWLPHTDNPVQVLADFQRENGAGDILLGHAAVHGATLNVSYGTKADVIVEYDNDMVAVDSAVFSGWPVTLLGHYHAAQKLGHGVEYVGSPLELSYGEAFQQKHVIILDLDTMERRYVVNQFSPRHLLVTPQDVRLETYKLDGNFVRLTVDGVKERDLVDLQRHITQNCNVLSFDTKRNKKKTSEDETVIEGARAVMRDTRQMIEKYAEEKGPRLGLNLTRLVGAGLRCLEKQK